MQYVNVQFFFSHDINCIITDNHGAKVYTYKNDLKYKLYVGDVVLVRVNDNDFGIAKVVEIFDDNNYKSMTTCSKDELKSVIGVIDVSLARKDYNKTKKIAEFDKVIKERFEKISKLNLLKQMAKESDDEYLNNILKEYEELLND